MVDRYGRWTYIPGTPENEKCDYDRLADAIFADGYEVKYDLEMLCGMVFNSYDDYLEEFDEDSYTGAENPDPWKYSIPDVLVYVQESGGWQEFDYEP